MDETVTITDETARTALRELELLIEETEDDDPDPLTDDVFQARNELQERLE